ncbi:hypothetical protein D3K17_17405 [Escherichia coli]|nr:hypothetical protein [Escherichia coli]
MTSLKTSIKTITYLSDIGCLEIQGASLVYLYKSQTSYPKYIWGYIGLSMSGCDRDQRYAGIIFVNGL